jgi:hypothetical protein
MEPNKSITKYYQLTGECFTFYFFLIPICELLKQPISFLSYLYILVLSLAVFSISFSFIRNYAVLVIALLGIMMFVFGVMNINLIISALSIIFVLWRFIQHEFEWDLGNEIKIIGLLLLGFIVDVIFFYNENLIWIALVTLLVITLGYQLSHIMSESTTQRFRHLQYSIFLFTCIFVGGIFLFAIFGIGNFSLANLWNRIVAFIRSLFAFEEKEHEPPEFGEVPPESRQTSFLQMEPSNIFLWIILGTAIIVLGVALFYMLKKKIPISSMKRNEKVRYNTKVTKGQKDKKKGKAKINSYHAPSNEIRLLVFKFEKWALKNDVGRKHYETIEEWFNRFDIDPSYLELYQKVRYGEKDLSSEEIRTFPQKLTDIKSKLNERISE